MDRIKLKKKLDDLKVTPVEYSLYGTLEPDRMILFEFYGKWIVFYLDSFSHRTNEKTFYSEDEACKYMLEQFIGLYQSRKRSGLETGRK